MVLLKKKYIFINLFIIILICEIYLSSFKVNLALQIIYFLGLLSNRNNKITIGFLKTISPLFIIFGLGFIGYIIQFYSLSNVSKDISYFIKPIVGILVGYFLFKKYQDVAVFYKTFLFLGIFTATIHLCGILMFGDFLKVSISNIRGDFGLDNFVEIFAFFILLFSNKITEKPFFQKRIFVPFFLSILFLSIILYFSRTMFVGLFLIGFSIFGYTKITEKSLKIIGIGMLLVGLFYVYLFSIKLDRNSEGIEAFFFKIKIAPEEIFKTKIDRENHKDLWDHWRGYEAKRALALMEENPHSFITGTGYGSLINLKFQAPIGEEGTMKFISRMHNGYMFVFYKTGIFGLFSLLVFIFSLYIKIYKSGEYSQIFIYRLISSIGLFYFFSTLIITGIYIPKDIIIFILGGALSFEKFYDSKN